MDIRSDVSFTCSICSKRHSHMFGHYVGVNYTCSFICERIQREIDFQFISVPKNPPNTPISSSSSSPDPQPYSSSISAPSTPRRQEIKK